MCFVVVVVVVVVGTVGAYPVWLPLQTDSWTVIRLPHYTFYQAEKRDH